MTFANSDGYFTHWRHYRARLATVQPWIDQPLSNGNSVLIPERLRLKFVAVTGDCVFTTSLSGKDTDYTVLQGEEIILVVQANMTLTTGATGEVYVDLGQRSSDWAKIIGILDNAGYGLDQYGVDPYGNP